MEVRASEEIERLLAKETNITEVIDQCFDIGLHKEMCYTEPIFKRENVIVQISKYLKDLLFDN